MNKVNKLSKEVLGMVEYSKEVIKNNLVSFNEKNQSDRLTESQLSNVINLVNLSLSQGMQTAMPTFQKVVAGALSETTKQTVEILRKKK
jgi:hypothetical protein